MKFPQDYVIQVNVIISNIRIDFILIDFSLFSLTLRFTSQKWSINMHVFLRIKKTVFVSVEAVMADLKVIKNRRRRFLIGRSGKIAMKIKPMLVHQLRH